MKDYSGSIGKIESFSTVDGPGIRSVVFLTGCPLRCIYCHNPEFLERQKDNYTPRELAEKLIKNKPYFGEYGGVTFSGGEPLLQSDFIIETAKILKRENIHIALDTSGVGNYNKEIFKYIDLVILDIKASNDSLFQTITKTNKLLDTINFLKECEMQNVPVIIRQVIVPGINDTKENILELKEILKPYNVITKIELLPYHTMALEKYKNLNKNYTLQDTKDLPIEKLEELTKYLS